MNKNYPLFFISGLILGFLLSGLVGGFKEKSSSQFDLEKEKILRECLKSKSPQKPGNFSYCEKDEDCALVDEACCSCGSGGKRISINKKNLGVWNQSIKDSCTGVFCPAVISKHPSCRNEAKPKCVKNSCTVI